MHYESHEVLRQPRNKAAVPVFFLAFKMMNACSCASLVKCASRVYIDCNVCSAVSSMDHALTAEVSAVLYCERYTPAS